MNKRLLSKIVLLSLTTSLVLTTTGCSNDMIQRAYKNPIDNQIIDSEYIYNIYPITTDKNGVGHYKLMQGLMRTDYGKIYVEGVQFTDSENYLKNTVNDLGDYCIFRPNIKILQDVEEDGQEYLKYFLRSTNDGNSRLRGDKGFELHIKTSTILD